MEGHGEGSGSSSSTRLQEGEGIQARLLLPIRETCQPRRSKPASSNLKRSSASVRTLPAHVLRDLIELDCPVLLAMAQTVSELSVPVPWGEIRGKVWGPDHGRPVLCLHGWADNCGSFSALVPLLPPDCRYVAVDLPGHGLSSHRPPGVFYMFYAYVADVCHIINGLQWTKFSIIGHSMGGNIAALFSALYPEMVDAVILLDSLGFLPTNPENTPKVLREGIDEILQYEKNTAKTERIYTYEKAVERLQTANSSLSEQSVHILLERGLVQVGAGFVFSRDFRLNFKNIARITLEQSLEMQSRIQAPVLVVLAKVEKNSLPLSSQFASKLLEGYQNTNHTVVTVTGDHHVHLNNPEVVAPLVSDFLQMGVVSQQHHKQTQKL